jgi:hypothetical protein
MQTSLNLYCWRKPPFNQQMAARQLGTTVRIIARALDDKSKDYCSIQVYRSLICIEQSIKVALGCLVFAANASPS